MELDELKKSWNALDTQLQKESITDENKIKELIASYRSNANRSLGSISHLQLLSIRIGAAALVILFIAWWMLPSLLPNELIQHKVTALLGFIAISIIGGMWWDWKTYCWNKATLIDEMSVTQVSQRMITFRRWTQYEVIAISIWIILFNILNYWVMEYHLASIATQAIIIIGSVICDVIIIYLLYKNLIYKHLNSIKKNIEELKDICTE